MTNMLFDVALVRSNSITYDPRVIKMVSSLSKRYKIILLGWDREMNHKSYEVLNKRVHIKRLRLRAPFGKISLVVCFPFFWIWVFVNLLIYRTSIIHACDLDSLVPSYAFKILSSTKVVFDSFDRYAMAYIQPKLRLIYAFIDNLENILAHNVDALISVSEERLSTFGNYRPKYAEVIMNCSVDMAKTSVRNEVLQRQLHNDFVLVYTGSIMYEKGLLQIEQAIRDFCNVRVFLAGRIIDDVIKCVLNNPKIHYLGLLRYKDAIALESIADVILILYDPSIPINRVANPSKLFEAMMLGIPVITNVCSEIVNMTGCGVVVDYNSDSVKEAILCLKNNPSLKKEMGANGRNAFEEIYNWSATERKLLDLYKRVLSN